MKTMRKQFKDFPTGEWLKAAGKCGYSDDEFGTDCDAKCEVKITNPGNDNAGFMMVRCTNGHTHEEFVGWTIAKESVTLGRLGSFFPLLGRSDHAYCASCGLIVVDVPLILWGPDAPKNVKWELDFCFDCAERIGVLNWIMPSQGPATTQVALSRKVRGA